MLALQLERNEAGTTQAHYTIGQGLELVRRSGVSHFYHYNHLGTTIALTASNQFVSDTYEHDAWGELLASTGSTVNPHTYVGRERYYRMANADLYHLGFRDYAQALGRFMTVDRVGQGTNRRQYVADNPVEYTDPTGLVIDRPGGRAAYDIYLTAGVLQVTIRIHLVRGQMPDIDDQQIMWPCKTPNELVPLPGGSRMLRDLFADWRAGVASRWSGKYDLCEVGNWGKCVKVRVALDIMEGPGAGVLPVCFAVGMGRHYAFGKGGVSLFFLHDSTLDWRSRPREVIVAHEAGHLLGYLDEYPTGHEPRIDPDSIMGQNIGQPCCRHYKWFAQWLSKDQGKTFQPVGRQTCANADGTSRDGTYKCCHPREGRAL